MKAENNYGVTALHFAAKCGSEVLVESLLGEFLNKVLAKNLYFIGPCLYSPKGEGKLDIY